MDNNNDLKRITRRRSRKYVAYHEAGHVVACYLLHIPFINVSIIKNEDSNGRFEIGMNHLNAVAHKLFTASRLDTNGLKFLYNDFIMYLSGYAAVEVLTDRPYKFDNRDLVKGSDIRKVSDDLLTLGYTDQTDKVNELRSEALTLVKQNWAAVEAVAAALLEKKELSSKQAREIIRQASGRVVEVTVEKCQDKPRTVIIERDQLEN